jgi:predicted DNA-binding mobile mystery protein A
MKTPRLRAGARRQLDQRFRDIGPASRFAEPPHGWVKAIREALGMSAAQLARRLNVKQPSVAGIEQSEEKGTIELATLRRVADALDCKLAYVLVPNRPLQETIRDRARLFVRRRREPIEHSMMLEDQEVVRQDTEALVDEVLRETNPRHFWD